MQRQAVPLLTTGPAGRHRHGAARRADSGEMILAAHSGVISEGLRT